MLKLSPESSLLPISINSRGILPFMVSAMALGYVIFHSIAGQYGWIESSKLRAAVVPARLELIELRQRRAQLESQVTAIRDGDAHSDAVDEQLRYILNIAHHKEVVIMNPHWDITTGSN